MYQQSDIRNPVTEEAIREHHAQNRVEETVREVLFSRKRAAPAEMVKMLHEGEETQRVWRAISSGMVNRRGDSGLNWSLGACLSFAGLCFARGRLDVLTEVVKAGEPKWMRSLPRLPDARLQYEALQMMLPVGARPRDWLRALTCYQLIAEGPSEVVSLFRIATEPITKHTTGFLDLALDIYPDHPDAAGLRKRNPEGAALLTQLQMERHIRTVGAAANAGTASVAPTRRRASI